MNKSDNKRLFKAIETNDCVVIDNILGKHPDEVDVFGISNRSCRDKTPLMYAMQCAQFDLARKLINLGANVNARMAGGPKSHVLTLAMVFGHASSPYYDQFVELAKLLVARGAEPSVALWAALTKYDRAHDKSEMVDLLIESGADPGYLLPAGSTIRELLAINRHLHTPRVLRMCGVAP